MRVKTTVRIAPAPGTENVDEDWMRLLRDALFDALQEAQIDIQAFWPIDTSTTFKAWITLDESKGQTIRVELRNDGDQGGGAYAAYVFRGKVTTEPGVKFVNIALDDENEGGVIYEVERAKVHVDEHMKGDGTIPIPLSVNRGLVARMARALAQAQVLSDGGSSAAFIPF